LIEGVKARLNREERKTRNQKRNKNKNHLFSLILHSKVLQKLYREKPEKTPSQNLSLPPK